MPFKRMKIILKCKECRKTTVIHTTKPIVCSNCGNTKWHCWRCGYEAEYEESTFCSRCRWFICPKCGACGCDFRKVKCPNCGFEIKKSDSIIVEWAPC